MQGQYDPEYKDIVEPVSAIIFLSTPHRGTNLADTLNRILQASIISSSKQFISELTKNSFTLQKLNEQFRHVAPKLDIVSFYETRMTPIGIKKNKVVCHSRLVAAHGVSFSDPFQMVLEKDSLVLGYPGEISRALDADHHGVCKFDSPDDPLYVNVRNVLKSLVRKYPLPSRLHCHAIWLHPSLYIKALAMSQYRLNMRIFVRSKKFLPCRSHLTRTTSSLETDGSPTHAIGSSSKSHSPNGYMIPPPNQLYCGCMALRQVANPFFPPLSSTT